MKHHSAFHRHIRTNIVARIIYRLICLAMLAFGILGSYVAIEQLTQIGRYLSRDSVATAKVKNTREVHDSQYSEIKLCKISYEFTIDGKRYDNKLTANQIINTGNCTLSVGDQIKIRYEKARPTNTAYGDNTLERNREVELTIASVFISALLLGIGFIGLVAIHKALRDEKAGLREESKQYYHRQAKIAKQK